MEEKNLQRLHEIYSGKDKGFNDLCEKLTAEANEPKTFPKVVKDESSVINVILTDNERYRNIFKSKLPDYDSVLYVEDIPDKASVRFIMAPKEETAYIICEIECNEETEDNKHIVALHFSNDDVTKCRAKSFASNNVFLVSLKDK